MIEEATLYKLLEKFYQTPDNEVIFIEHKAYRTIEWTTRKIKETIQTISAMHKKDGIHRGDRIIICAKNNPFWVCLFLSLIKDGIILVPLDVNSSNDFINDIAKRVKAKKLYLSSFKKFPTHNKLPITIIESFAYDVEQQKTSEMLHFHSDIKRDDIVEIVYTSGSTGNPKGVIITQENLYADIHNLLAAFHTKPHAKMLSILPLSHMFEQTVGLFAQLLMHTIVVYPKSIRPNDILSALEEDHITGMICVPAVLQLFMEAIQRQIEKEKKTILFKIYLFAAKFLPQSLRKNFVSLLDRRLQSVEVFFVGGAPLDGYVETFWSNLGITVLQGYGLTEASPIVTLNTFNHHKKGSVGKPLKNVEIHLSEEGELFIKGNNITPGYYENVQATKEALHDGWFHTGDIGFIDQEGFLFLKGRKKNMIVKANGLKIYPEDIEMVVNEFPQVKESVVVGLPDNKNIKIIAAIVFKKAVENIDVFTKAINQKLGESQHVDQIIIWQNNDFPKTPTRKIIRKQVLEEIIAMQEKKNTLPQKQAVDPLYTLIAEISEKSPQKMTPETLLVEDLLMDSLKRLALLSAIETEYNSSIEETEISQKTTIKDLQELITKYTGKLSQPKEYSSWANDKSIIMTRKCLQTLLFSGISLFQKIEVIGKEHIPRTKVPIIIIANHTSHLDTPTILRILTKEQRSIVMVAAAKDYFFTNPISSFIATLLFHAFPLDRQNNIKDDLLAIGHYLDRGQSILLYPEGTRSTNGSLQPFKNGIGIIAQEMDAPILPIKIEGNFLLLPKGKFFPSSGNVRVTVGKPFRAPYGLSYLETTALLQKDFENIQ